MTRTFLILFFGLSSLFIHSQEVNILVLDNDVYYNLINNVYIFNTIKNEIELFSKEGKTIRFKVNKNDEYKFFAPSYNDAYFSGVDLLKKDTLFLTLKHQEYDLLEIERYSYKSLLKEWKSLRKRNNHRIKFSDKIYSNFLKTTKEGRLVESYYSNGDFNAENTTYNIKSGDFRFGIKSNFINLNLNDFLLEFIPFNKNTSNKNAENFLIPSQKKKNRLNNFKISSDSSPKDSLIQIKIKNQYLSEETFFNRIRGTPIKTSVYLYNVDVFQSLTDTSRNLIADSVYLELEYEKNFIDKFYYKLFFTTSKTNVEGYFIQGKGTSSINYKNKTFGQFKEKNTYAELILKRQNYYLQFSKLFSGIDSISIPNSQLEHYLLSKVTNSFIMNEKGLATYDNFITLIERDSPSIQRLNSYTRYENNIPFIWHYRIEDNGQLNFFPTFFDKITLLTKKNSIFLNLKMFLIYNYIESQRKQLEETYKVSISPEAYYLSVKSVYENLERQMNDWVEYPLNDEMLWILSKDDILNRSEEIVSDFLQINSQSWNNMGSIFESQPDLEDILKLNISDEDRNKIINFYLKINTFFIDEILNDRIAYSSYGLQYLLIQTIVLQKRLENINKVCTYLAILKSRYNELYFLLLEEDKDLKIDCSNY